MLRWLMLRWLMLRCCEGEHTYRTSASVLPMPAMPGGVRLAIKDRSAMLASPVLRCCEARPFVLRCCQASCCDAALEGSKEPFCPFDTICTNRVHSGINHTRASFDSTDLTEQHPPGASQECTDPTCTVPRTRATRTVRHKNQTTSSTHGPTASTSLGALRLWHLV